jgi:hypothetical protein
MKILAIGPLYLLAGGLGGLASVLVAIEQYGAAPAQPGSPWRSWDMTASKPAYPYALDHFLLAGRLPPATGQMREFSAARDGGGARLGGRCDYTLSLAANPPQWWSLAAVAAGGGGMAGDAHIGADTAVAEHDGSLRITVSRRPAPGNWVRPPGEGSFTLLYSLAETSPDRPSGAAPLFAIARKGC